MGLKNKLLVMKYIKTPKELYQKYVNENGTDRISKGIKLQTNYLPRNILSKLQLNEVKYIPLQTEYKVLNKKIGGDDLMIYVFQCNSSNKYRLDLLEIKPENYWLDKKHYNVSFSLIDRDDDNYNDISDYGELFELFKRMMFILNTITDDIIFIIGNTFDKRKNLLYQDFIDSFNDCDIKHGNSSYFKDSVIYIKRT